MKLRVLGCYGGELFGYKSSSFLVNDSLLIDAGNVNVLTSVNEISGIRHLFLSHVHLDHIKALPFVAEQLAEEGKGLDVFGTEKTIEALRNHIFNGIIWPDLSRLPSPENPAIRYKILGKEETVTISGLSIKAVPVSHTVSSVGFVISDSEGAIVYSGDTSGTERIWGEANNTLDLKAIIVEVSYPNRLHKRAVLTKHLTPASLTDELKKINLKEMTLILVSHLKPPFVDEIKKEICELAIDNLILLEEGDIFEV